MKLFATTISFAFISITLLAQKEANVWHFGFGYGLDFNSGEAVQITGAMSTFEGCTASCSTPTVVVAFPQAVRIPDTSGTETMR
jgi:preprotein translocase subunit SecF